MDQWKVRYSGNMFSLKKVERGAGLYDYDGNEYQSIIIGSQEWLASNYRPIHYANGDPITHASSVADWAANTEGAWCYYNNDQSYFTDLGRLYNQHAVFNLGGFVHLERNGEVEADWRVPLYADFTALWAELGGASIAGGKMKEMGTEYWIAPNVGATNSSEFTGRGGGVRWENGSFVEFRSACTLWTIHDAYSVQLGYHTSSAYAFICGYRSGLSVRLVRDI